MDNKEIRLNGTVFECNAVTDSIDIPVSLESGIVTVFLEEGLLGTGNAGFGFSLQKRGSNALLSVFMGTLEAFLKQSKTPHVR